MFIIVCGQVNHTIVLHVCVQLRRDLSGLRSRFTRAWTHGLKLACWQAPSLAESFFLAVKVFHNNVEEHLVSLVQEPWGILLQEEHMCVIRYIPCAEQLLLTKFREQNEALSLSLSNLVTEDGSGFSWSQTAFACELGLLHASEYTNRHI